MSDKLPNLYLPGTLPGLDPRTARVMQDLFDRVNYLTVELDRVREMTRSASPGVDAARKESPVEGIITIPYRDAGGQDGAIRVSKDGVIVSYVNPADSIFPYVDLSTVGNVGVGLDSLHSFSIPANTLASDGDWLHIRYAGKFATNDNDKRIQVSIDGQSIHNTGAFDQDSGLWVYDLDIFRLSAISVRAAVSLYWNFITRDGGGIMGGNGLFATEDKDLPVANLNSNAVTLLVQGEAIADNDIVQNVSHIKYYRPRTRKLV